MKISVQSQNLVDQLGAEKTYQIIREAGFTAIDWNIDHAWNFRKIRTAEILKDLCIFESPIEEILAYYDEELRHIRANGLTITQAHAPFPCYEEGREDILDYSIGIYQNVIRFCEAVGCKNLVIHGIPFPQAAPEENTYEKYEALNRRLYESLIPTLQETDGVTVCLENLFSRYNSFGFGACFRDAHCSDPHEAVAIIDSLNEKAGKKCFGLCFDTGHLNLLRRNPRTWIPTLGNRIVCLHLHDNSQDADRHLAPYTGNICWQEILRELKRVGYNGDLSFETFAQTDTNRLPPELIPAFLELIAEIGAYFRTQLS